MQGSSNAAIAHEQIFQFLNTLQPPPEIIDLQMAMMEVLSKQKKEIETSKLEN